MRNEWKELNLTTLFSFIIKKTNKKKIFQKKKNNLFLES